MRLPQAMGIWLLIDDLYEAAKEEGRACCRAAGIEFVSMAESEKWRAALFPLKLVNGKPFPGGSTWQSLARGARQTEIDYLTGEIVLLGRLHGISTPINAALQRLVREMATLGIPPASLNPNEFRARLPAG